MEFFSLFQAFLAKVFFGESIPSNDGETRRSLSALTRARETGGGRARRVRVEGFRRSRPDQPQFCLETSLLLGRPPLWCESPWNLDAD